MQHSPTLRSRIGDAVAVAQANSSSHTSSSCSTVEALAALREAELAQLDATWATLEAYMWELPAEPDKDGRATPVLMRRNVPPPKRSGGADVTRPGAAPVAAAQGAQAAAAQGAQVAAATAPQRPATARLPGPPTHLAVELSPRASRNGQSVAAVRADESGGRRFLGRPAAAQQGIEDLTARRRKNPEAASSVLRHARTVTARASAALASSHASDAETTHVWRDDGAHADCLARPHTTQPGSRVELGAPLPTRPVSSLRVGRVEGMEVGRSPV